MNRFWHKDVRRPAVAVSILCSIISVLGKPVPNIDAYTYLHTAEIFLQDGLAAAYNYYPWATYAVLTGIVHWLTGLDMLIAAHCLNALFFALLVHAFVSLAREIDTSWRFTLFAALCILLYPQLNEYRADIIRDIGFLAFSLLALLQLVRLNRSRRLRHAAWFTLASLAAALFRPEALVYLLLAPVVLLFNRDWSSGIRLRGISAIYGITILIGLAAALLAGGNSEWLAILSDGITVYRPFLEQAASIISGGSPELAAAIFHEHAAEYSGQYITVFLLAGLLVILFIKLFTGLGWVYLAALIYGIRMRMYRLPRHIALPVLTYLGIGILILLGFIFVTRFLTTRYTMLFSTVLVLLVPLILERSAASMEQKRKYPQFLRFAVLIAVYLFIDSFISFGESKRYQLEAADWLQENLPADARLRSGNHLIAYRLRLTPDYDRIETDARALIEASEAGDYLALDVHDDNLAELQQLIDRQLLTLVAAFPDADEPRLAVYQRR